MVSLAAGNQVGDALTVLWEEGTTTRVGYGEVASEVPFSLLLDGSDCPPVDVEVRLVRDQGDRWVAGSATVAVCDEGHLLLRGTRWEEPSQRVHERTEVDWPVTLRILDERGTRETFQIGVTTDISLGGAALEMEEAPEVGSLVEVRAHPRGAAPVRAVAVVVRRVEENVGLAFLYLWGAAFLESQPAKPAALEWRRAA